MRVALKLDGVYVMEHQMDDDWGFPLRLRVLLQSSMDDLPTFAQIKHRQRETDGFNTWKKTEMFIGNLWNV